MEKLNGIIALLGEENEKKIRDQVTDLIIECVADDLKEYDHECYILNPEELIDFIDECRDEAFARMKEEIIENMMSKLRLAMKEED